MSQPQDRPRARTPWLAFASTVLAVVALDQLSKLAVRRLVPVGQHVFAWPSARDPFMSITHEVNTGVAFGLFRGQNGLLVGLVLVIAVGLTVAYARLDPRDTFLRLALSLQVGGALGNVLDRLRLGHVVDFIHVGRWPVFNVADSAVSLGTALLLLYFARHGDGRPHPAPSVALPVAPSDEPASDLGR